MKPFDERKNKNAGNDWLAAEIFSLSKKTGADTESCLLLEKFARALAETVFSDGELYLTITPDGAKILEEISAENSPLAAVVGTEKTFDAGKITPLVFDESANALYFFRHYAQERRTAKTLAELAAAPAREISERTKKIIDAALPFPLNDGQKNAVRAIVSRRLTLVSGGPGTGKTTLLLRALLCIFSENVSAKIILAAPTGKAAARMKESISRQAETLAAQADADKFFPKEIFEKIDALEPATLHRILRAGTAAKIVRLAPEISADFVIVDEASMIDQPLADRLCCALREGTRLVLVGDGNQLDAVGPGHVFGALCNADGLRAARVELTESRRFREDGVLGKLARAIVSGDAESALSLVEKNPHAEIFNFSKEKFSSREIDAELLRLFPEKLREVPADADPAEMLALVESVKLLSPLRNGEFGTDALNARAEKLFARGKNAGSPHFHGRPIIISRNAAREDLFNGDLGIVLREGNAFFAYFRKTGGSEPRRVPVAFLPEHETAYALSIHKSQGSEFSRLCVLFPPATETRLEFFTRQLLYTAITRFNENGNAPYFHLIYDAETLANAVRRKNPQHSLLPTRLSA